MILLIPSHWAIWPIISSSRPDELLVYLHRSNYNNIKKTWPRTASRAHIRGKLCSWLSTSVHFPCIFPNIPARDGIMFKQKRNRSNITNFCLHKNIADQYQNILCLPKLSFGWEWHSLLPSVCWKNIISHSHYLFQRCERKLSISCPSSGLKVYDCLWAESPCISQAKGGKCLKPICEEERGENGFRTGHGF